MLQNSDCSCCVSCMNIVSIIWVLIHVLIFIRGSKKLIPWNSINTDWAKQWLRGCLKKKEYTTCAMQNFSSFRKLYETNLQTSISTFFSLLSQKITQICKDMVKHKQGPPKHSKNGDNLRKQNVFARCPDRLYAPNHFDTEFWVVVYSIPFFLDNRAPRVKTNQKHARDTFVFPNKPQNIEKMRANELDPRNF